MRSASPLIALVAVALLAAAFAVPARASTTDTIVRDCQHSQTGSLTGTYTKAQLRNALNNLPSDVLEYSGCYDQINQALREVGSGGRGGSGTGGGGTGAGGASGASDGTGGSGTTGGGSAPGAQVPQHVGTRQPVEIAGTAVQPGTIPAIGRDAHTLPTPLIVFLVLLGLGALVPLALTIARRVIARRRA